MRVKIIVALFFLLFVSACSDSSQMKVEIDRGKLTNTLFVQKIQSDSSQELSKTIINEKQIAEVINKIEDIEIEDMDSSTILTEIKSENTYMFSFIEGKADHTGKPTYVFFANEEGYFYFSTMKDNKIKLTSKSVAKHKEILDEINNILHVDF
ncbi:hypothetical protein [Aquibacillus kalidii]|uniref:hypothetical protein n=1 Tax=Aquibacillus kalidii TaxID=2762597 RepID=UPI0016455C54|nr:hypothetical protein [Aquibacillus kalidii]